MISRARTFTLCLLTVALLLAASALSPSPVSPSPTQTAQAQTVLPTFVDLPAGTTETYPGSGLYKAGISDGMAPAIVQQTQENYDKYGIAKESNLGLPLGSIYVKAANGRYVELALYERAAFTVFNGQPARQILSTILFEGKIQVSETESVNLPNNIRQSFSTLPIAGEPAQYTPTLANISKHISTDPSKAEDATFTSADKLLILDGTLIAPTPADNVQPLPLGAPNSTTGHRTPEVMSAGLSTLFGEKIVENAGLPISPALWVRTQVGGKYTVVAVQVFERMIVTYNPANDEANRVQVGLGGALVYGGLSTNIPPPTATPRATEIPTEVPPTATPEVLGILYDHPLAEMPSFAGFQDELVLNNPEDEFVDTRKLALALLKTFGHQSNQDTTTYIISMNNTQGKDMVVYPRKAGEYHDPKYIYLRSSLYRPAQKQIDWGKRVIFKFSDDAAPNGDQLLVTGIPQSFGISDEGQLSIYVSPSFANYPNRGLEFLIAAKLEELYHLNEYPWPDKAESPYLETIGSLMRNGQMSVPPSDLAGVIK